MLISGKQLKHIFQVPAYYRPEKKASQQFCMAHSFSNRKIISH